MMNKLKFDSKSPLRTVLGLFKGDYHRLLISGLFLLIKTAPVYVTPILTAKIINVITYPETHQLHEIWWYGLILMGVLLQNIPTHTLYINHLSIAVRNMEIRLRSKLVRRVQILSLAFFESFKSGRLHTKILRDVETIAQVSFHFYEVFLLSLLTVVIAVVYTVQKDPIVALFFLITVPMAVVLIRIFRGRMKLRNREYRQAIEGMSARTSEMLEMLPVTRAHGAAESETAKMDEVIGDIKSRARSLDFLNAVFGSTTWVGFRFFQVICLVFTGYLAWHGRMLIGDVVMYQGFFTMIVSGVNMMLGMFPQLNMGLESLSSLAEILETTEIENDHGKLEPEGIKGDICFHDIDFKYTTGKVPAVKDFNLWIKKGETVAFVGASGSGKTTLMNLLTGFYTPQSGYIMVDGHNLADMKLSAYRQVLAVVSQNTILFSASLKENIIYGMPDVDEKRLNDALERSNINEFIDQLPDGIDTMLGEHGTRLSGGQRQRVAIARAIIRDPSIIIFDEATSALDVMSELYVQEAINNVIKDRTCLIVAHRLSTVRKADRIIVMEDGRCVESGTEEELLSSKGRYYKMKQLQVG